MQGATRLTLIDPVKKYANLRELGNFMREMTTGNTVLPVKNRLDMKCS